MRKKFIKLNSSLDFKKPWKARWICNETWKSLSLKEQHYIIMLYQEKNWQRYIMKMLHITDRTTYWRIQERVRVKLASDVAKYNLLQEKIRKKAKNR